MLPDKPYDSTEDTEQHIRHVQGLLSMIISELDNRAAVHDQSKLQSPEKEIFDEFTQKLKGLTYGSDEYHETKDAMGPALMHHYEVNSHHPEHYKTGINGMSLLDVMEMVADWKAASLRHADGDFHKSLYINKERFGINDQLFEIILHTVGELGW